MRRGRAKDKERRETEERQTTGYRGALATGQRKTGTKESLKIQESDTEGGMKGNKKKKSTREKVVGCQTGVEAPRPSLPVPPQPIPSPPPTPTPPLPGRGGVDMGARWGGDEKKHSTHGWRLSY